MEKRIAATTSTFAAAPKNEPHANATQSTVPNISQEHMTYNPTDPYRIFNIVR